MGISIENPTITPQDHGEFWAVEALKSGILSGYDAIADQVVRGDLRRDLTVVMAEVLETRMPQPVEVADIQEAAEFGAGMLRAIYLGQLARRAEEYGK